MFVSFFLSTLLTTTLSIKPYRLRVEYLENPYGIDTTNPRFFWSVDNEGVRGNDQVSYRLTVYERSPSGTVSLAADSSIVKSNSSNHITLNSLTLKSSTNYLWNVTIYDSNNKVSINNPIAFFSTSLLGSDKNEWDNAKWVGISDYKSQGNAYQVRSQGLIVNKTFYNAVCYIAMPGYYKAWINENRLENGYLGYFTTFEKTIYYDTIDCTKSIKQGSNVFGIWLGNGWYSQPSINLGPPMFKLIIIINNQDGTTTKYYSNGNDFYKKQGPIRMNDIYIGEWYDSTYETPGWLSTNYNDNTWNKCEIITNPTVGTLKSSSIMPKIEETNIYTALTISEPMSDVYVFDMGQNIAGISRIKIPGNNMRGYNITIQHSEEIDENGLLVNMYSNSPMIATYTLRGDGNDEYYQSSFTYFGFQYIQITGYPTIPDLNSIESIFLHSNIDTSVGSIVFGETNINNDNNGYLLNKVQHMTRFASLSNYMNIPTDCPQRERRGWLGDAQLSAETTIHNFDMAAAYTKFIYDITDSQEISNKNGALGDCVPYYHHGALPGDPSWTIAYLNIPYYMWKYYGDTRIIVNNYNNIKLYMNSMESELDSKTGLLPNSINHYGDWCAVIPSGVGGCARKSAIISTYDWAKQCQIFSQMATIVNNTNDVTSYKTKFESAKQAIYNNFWDKSVGAFVDPTNTAPVTTLNAMALDLGVLTDQTDIDSVMKYITNYEQVTEKFHMGAGIIGVRYIYPELCKNGFCNLAMNITLQRTYPSYGYWYENGATTLWENWGSSRYHADGSKNHIMFGAQGAWYYQYLAGIRQDDMSYNWDIVIIDPYINTTLFGINNIEANINTYKGEILSSWSSSLTSDICATADENSNAVLKCNNNGIINKIVFASYGTPTGSCGNYQIDQSCNNNNSMSVVTKDCLNKNSCIVAASNDDFGYDPCLDVVKHLDIQYTCQGSTNLVLTQSVTIPSGSKGKIYLRRGINNNADMSQWSVQESGKVIWENSKFSNGVSGIVSGVQENDALVFTVLSGEYSFNLYA